MISIIIPVLNQQDMSYECIRTIMENTAAGTYEMVIIDNGSDPPFKPPFTGFNHLTLIRNESNRGFPVAVNQGINSAKGDTIIVMNNDVFVPPGGFSDLIEWLSTYSIVGPLTNYCAGVQCVQIPEYNTMDDFYKEAEAIHESNIESSEEVNFIIGFCMAFKRSLYDKLGPFDESLWPCSGEEIDFCFRAKEAGHKIGIAHDVYMHHIGSVTFNELQDKGQLEYVRICEKTDKHLEKKWGKDFWMRQELVK